MKEFVGPQLGWHNLTVLVLTSNNLPHFVEIPKHIVKHSIGEMPPIVYSDCIACVDPCQVGPFFVFVCLSLAPHLPGHYEYDGSRRPDATQP